MSKRVQVRKPQWVDHVRILVDAGPGPMVEAVIRLRHWAEVFGYVTPFATHAGARVY